MKKILLFDNSGLIIHDDDYCVESKTGNFAKELKDLGHQVTFFGQQLPPTSDTVHIFKVKESGMLVAGRKRLRNKLVNYLLLYLKAIPSIYKADFVYMFYPNTFGYILPIVRIFRKKYGLYIRGEQGIESAYSRMIYKSAFIVFTVSPAFTNYVNKIVGKDIAFTIKPMIQFTNNDISTSRTYINKDAYEILYLGRLSFDKGLKELLLAMAALKKEGHNLILKIVGNGEFMEELKNFSLELELTSSVTFEGGVYDQEKIAQYYRNADLFILPTYHEGFPRTLYEAMIFGTPIITTFVGGISELMKNNINSLRIEPKSVESIVTVVKKSISDYDKTMKPLALNATQLISEILNSNRLSHAETLSKSLQDS